MNNKNACDGEILSVQSMLEHINKSGFMELHHAHIRLWFRGHSNSEWELRPAVYRPAFPAEQEAERLLTEQHLTQDFRVHAAGLLTGRESEAEIYFLQQHYRMPTQLLDWTHSPLVALYFAVTDESSNLNFDGEFVMMDAYQLSPQQNAEQYFEGIATARHPTVQKVLDVVFKWQTVDRFPRCIIPVRPDHFDHRISLQRGSFTLHVPDRKALTKTENNTLRTFSIPTGAKGSIRKELSLLGIDEFAVYGDLESLSRRLKRAHKIHTT
jgi:hypothetical protein